jgi:hypothetical protein
MPDAPQQARKKASGAFLTFGKSWPILKLAEAWDRALGS